MASFASRLVAAVEGCHRGEYANPPLGPHAKHRATQRETRRTGPSVDHACPASWPLSGAAGSMAWQRRFAVS